MTPAQAIRSLDKQLRMHGQDVDLRKGNTLTGQKTVRGFVRGYKPAELIGGLQQGDKRVVISATGLSGFGDVSEIKFLFFDGKARAVEGEPEIIRVAGQLVRVNLTVRG